MTSATFIAPRNVVIPETFKSSTSVCPTTLSPTPPEMSAPALKSAAPP